MKTRAIIRSQALAHNLAVVRQLAPHCPIAAIVKANAYGHGVAALLPTLTQHSDAFAVARIEEADALRQAGYHGRLLLLSGVSDRAELAEALSLRLDITVHEPEQLTLLSQYHYAEKYKTALWLKMDSGMHRLGFAPRDYAAAYQTLRALPWCSEIIGMTHFSSADDVEKNITQEQLDCYFQHSNALALDNHSLANSAAIMAWPASHRGWVRPGLMMYGISPIADTHTLQAVMQLEAQVIATRTIPASETTGYNQRWRAERDSHLAFVAAGYADGYPITALNNSVVAVNGVRVPVVGRVSMDTIAIDCTALAEKPRMGDWVELWGDTISVAEVAAAAGSIPYQLLTAVSPRVARIFR